MNKLLFFRIALICKIWSPKTFRNIKKELEASVLFRTSLIIYVKSGDPKAFRRVEESARSIYNRPLEDPQKSLKKEPKSLPNNVLS